MNEELQQALVQVINSAVNAKEFIVQQTPEVIQQLLLWHGVGGFLLFIAGVFWCVATVIVAKFSIKTLTSKLPDSAEYFEYVFVYFLVCAGGVAIALPGLCLLNFEWLKVWLAPKVWLIEYASNLIK
jgi:hypothetical protein